MATVETIHEQMLGAINRGDLDGFRALLHPEYSYVGGDGSRQEGPEAGLAVAKLYLSAFPDMKAEVVSRFSEGDRVVAEFRVTGTHQGELAGIAPTGKTMDLTVCNIIIVKDGLCFQEREYFDALTMMVQLGALESPMQG